MTKITIFFIGLLCGAIALLPLIYRRQDPREYFEIQFYRGSKKLYAYIITDDYCGNGYYYPDDDGKMAVFDGSHNFSVNKVSRGQYIAEKHRSLYSNCGKRCAQEVIRREAGESGEGK